MTDISLEHQAEYKIECNLLKCKECNIECIHEFCKECKYQKNETTRQVITSVSTLTAGSLLGLIFTFNPAIIIGGGILVSFISCKIMNSVY